MGTAAPLFLAVDAHAAQPVTTVHCGQSITEDTRLGNDLTDCPGDGIVIGADNITLDLNGHTVDGDGAGDDPEDFGIDNTAGHDGVTVKGGSIREFVEGVEIEFARDNLLRDLATSHQAHAGVFVFESTDVRIERNSVSSNVAGIVVVRSSHVRVEHNSGSGIEFGGVAAIESDHVRIAKNSLTDGGGGGVVLVNTHDSRVEGNDADRNDQGIVLGDGSSGNLISRNDASGNTFGVLLDPGTHDNVVGNNVVRASEIIGVLLVGSDDNRIEKNSVAGNGTGSQTDVPEAGIYLFAPPDEPGLTPDGNLISQNLVVANDGDGLVVDAGDGENLVEGNRANGNADDGIDVDSPATTLTRNTANDNQDLGIEAVPGVTDGGGNRASGNGNPLQCTNVFCR